MSLEVTGRLLHIGEVEKVSEKFSKRTIVLDMSEEYNGTRYDNPVPFQLSQKKLDLVNGYSVGDEVILKFNLKGRKWEKDGKTTWFGTSEVWRVDGQKSNSQPQQNQPQYQPAPAQNIAPANFSAQPIIEDDLPF